jgi:hypothetical protein
MLNTKIYDHRECEVGTVIEIRNGIASIEFDNGRISKTLVSWINDNYGQPGEYCLATSYYLAREMAMKNMQINLNRR